VEPQKENSMNKPTKNPLHFFSAKASAGALTLDIMDVIGADMFGDGITAGAVGDAIKLSGDISGITLNINSPGGSLFEGVAIYNTLKASGKSVTVNVIGMAASAASLIAMAGDKIVMGLGTQMMIHRAMAMSMGFSDDMRKMADTLDTVSASAADLYVSRTGMDKGSVLALMAAETWMSPEQAVAQGFATSVSKEAKAIANTFNLSAFKNAPAELKAVAEVEAPDPEVADDVLIDILRKRIDLSKRK
jgi:ATP-dependent Clp protease protease subunit